MSARVQGFRVREPRVVVKAGPPSQRESSSMSSLAQAWATFGEAKSVLEKLDSSPPSKSSHTLSATHTITTSQRHTVTGMPPAAPTATREQDNLRGTAVNGPLPSGGTSPVHSVSDAEQRDLGPGLEKTAGEVPTSRREEPLAEGGRRVNFGGVGAPSGSQGSRKPGSGIRGERKKSEKTRRENAVSSAAKVSTKSTPHTTTTSHPITPHTNTKAIFGPAVNFGAPPPTMSQYQKSTTPGSTARPQPAQPATGGSLKIDLADDTLATLRSKVEAQKLALEATNSRLRSLRQPPVTSEPCIYPLPEVTQSFASASSTLPTSTTSHLHPHPPSHPHPHPPSHPPPPTSTRVGVRHQPRHRKVASVPPPPPRNPPRAAPASREAGSVRGTHSHPLSSTATESTGTTCMVRKIGKVSAPVDPLRTRTRGTSRATRTVLSAPAAKRSATENRAPPKRRQVVLARREQSPPHNRSWALRPAATSIVAASTSDVELESSASVSSERPGLVPLVWKMCGEEGGRGEGGKKTRSEEGGEGKGERRTWEKEGGEGEGGMRTWGEEGGEGEVGMRPNLAQMLRDLEASPGGESEGERQRRGQGQQHPFPPASSSSKRRRLVDPENEPLPQPPHTKPYNHAEVQRYIRQKQRERRVESHRRQEEEERERRERQDRQRELMQRQRRIVQANLRARHRERVERVQDGANFLHSGPPLLTVTSPYSTTPRVHPSPPHSSPVPRSHSPSPHRGTYTSSLSSPHYSTPPSNPSLSPRTYTVSSNPRQLSPQAPAHIQINKHTTTQECHSGTSPLPTAEPFQTTGDQQTSREDRIRALTQSALDLKKRIAAEAERIKRNRQISPSQSSSAAGHVSLTTSSPPHTARTPMSYPSLPTSSHGLPSKANNERGASFVSLPGVQSVRRHALLAEEARREGEAASRIQAAFRGYRVRKSLQWQLPSGHTLGASLRNARVGDGEEDGGVGVNGVPKTTASHQSRAVQTSATMVHSPLLQKATTTPSTAVVTTATASTPQQVCPVATPPWQERGGDPLSVINIFARQKGHLHDTLSQLKTQKLSELRELQTSTTSLPSSHTPPDHTHPAELSHTSSVEDKSPTTVYSLSFPSPSLHNEVSSRSPSLPTPAHSSLSSILTATPSQTSLSHTHTSQHHTSQSVAHPKEDVPAITPPGSPSFVDTFSADVSPLKPLPADTALPAAQHTATSSSDKSPSISAAGETSRGPTGGRLSPRSLSLKLQAELTLLETIEESMRQLATVEGSQALSTAQQETVTLAQLLDTQRQRHEGEISSVAARARAVEEERARGQAKAGEEGRAAVTELQRVREEMEEMGKQEAERIAHMEGEMTRRAQEATQQLAEVRAAASEAVINSARLQVEAAHNMAVSVATAAAREAVTAAMVGTSQPPVSSNSPPETAAGGRRNKSATTNYTSDFEDSFPPDSLAEDSVRSSSIHTEVEETASQLVPAAGTSSDSTLTPVLSAVESEGEGRGGKEGVGRCVSGELQTSVPEEVDEAGEEPSFHELLPSESHRRMHLSLSESESHASSPAHSAPHTPSAVGERSPSPFTVGEDSFFQFMSRMMEQYMKEEEVRSRHRALLLQLREKTLKEKTKAELEWLKLKQKNMRGKGEDDCMPSLESRQRGLLRKLEAEQAEIRRLQRVQQEATRERRLMLEQHREISSMQHSANYYRDKLRRHSARESREHFTPSPSHHSASPVPSEVASQVSEEELTHSSSPSPTLPLPHSSPTCPLPHSSPPQHTSDHSPSVTMPTDTANTTIRTPTLDTHTARELKKLADHDKYLTQREKRLQQRRQTAEAALRQQEELVRREQELDEEERKIDSIISQALHRLHPAARSGGKTTAPKKSLLVETTPTQPLATPTTQDNYSEVSEVLDHTPSESIPEEVSEQAMHTASWPATAYSSDTFESSDHTLTPHTTLPSSHPHPVTSTPSPLVEDDSETTSAESLGVSGSSGGVGSLELRISHLRQQLDQRRADVRRARGEQRQRKRALLREEEGRLRRRLETLDSELVQLQSSHTPVTNHLPPPSSPPSTTTLPILPPGTLSLESDSLSHHVITDRESSTRTHQVSEELSYTPLNEDVAVAEVMGTEEGLPNVGRVEEKVGGEEGEEGEEEEDEVSEASELSEPVSEDDLQQVMELQSHLSGQPSSQPEMSEREQVEREGDVVGEERNSGEVRDDQATQSEEVRDDEATQSEEVRDDQATQSEEVRDDQATQSEEVRDDQATQSEEVRDDEATQSEEVRDDQATQSEEVRDDQATQSEEVRDDQATQSEEVRDDQATQSEEVRDDEATQSEEVRDDQATQNEEVRDDQATQSEEEDYTESWPSDQGPQPITPTNSMTSSTKHPVSDPIALLATTLDTTYTVGQRVLVGGAEPGTIRFIGSTHFKEGVWIGVELDGEKGKNNGSIDGRQYFSCRAGHGVFAPVSKVAALEEESAAGGGGGKHRGGSQSDVENSIVEDVEEVWSETESGDLTPIQQVSVVQTEPAISPLPVEEERDREMQGNEGEAGHSSVISDALTHTESPPQTHQSLVEKSEVEGSRDLEPSSPAVPPPQTLPQEEVATAPHLPAPPPDIVKEAPEQTAESQTGLVHVTPNVDHLANDLAQELANEAFHTMHRIWRHKSPSHTGPSLVKELTITNHQLGVGKNNIMTNLEQRTKAQPELSRKADRITDELFAMLLKSETDLVCTLRSAKNTHAHPEPTSPHRHSSSSPLFTPPSLPTIQETCSPPSSPTPPPPLSPPPLLPPPGDSPPGSPSRQLPASAARVVACERSPPIHRETSPPSMSRSLSSASLSSLVDKDHFVSAHCMVPSNSEQIDTIVEHACTHLRGSSSPQAAVTQVSECPPDVLSLFSGSQELSKDEERCHEAYNRLVYDLTAQVLRDMLPAPLPPVSVWMKHSPTLNSQLVAAKRKAEEFDLGKVQKKVYGLLMRGQLPSQLPPVKFLHGMRRVGGKDIDFIDSVLIREVRREEAGWVDYHQDETAVKLRVADSLLDSLLTEAVQVISTIERKRRRS